MVKKRVGKVSSRNKSASKKTAHKNSTSKKNIRDKHVKTAHRKKVIHLIVKKTTGLKTVVKETPKPVEQETKALMIVEHPKTTLPMTVEEPKKESHAQPKKIDIPPMFVDGEKSVDTEAKEIELPKTRKNHEIGKILLIIGKISIGIIILFFLIVLFSSIEPNETRIVTKTVTTTKNIPMNISFDKYMSLQNRTYVEQVSLLGFLREEMRTDKELQIFDKYIVDDYNNKIYLSMSYPAEQAFGKYFTVNKTTENTYNVSGTFKYGYDRYIFVVKNITAKKRPVIRQEFTEINNFTERDRGLKINISKGLDTII
ncbi:MAG: hypothetical protein ACP5NW_00695 [Candidatus Woesearchaeota archaeon]